jgi:hypothetical protein
MSEEQTILDQRWAEFVSDVLQPMGLTPNDHDLSLLKHAFAGGFQYAISATLNCFKRDVSEWDQERLRELDDAVAKYRLRSGQTPMPDVAGAVTCTMRATPTETGAVILRDEQRDRSFTLEPPVSQPILKLMEGLPAADFHCTVLHDSITVHSMLPGRGNKKYMA